MKLMQIDELIYAWLDPAVKCWFKDQCRNPGLTYYLYYKESTDSEHGAIVIAENPLNEDWKLAAPIRVSPMWTIAQAKQILKPYCNTLPLIKKS